jgi:hypothetical protein
MGDITDYLKDSQNNEKPKPEETKPHTMQLKDLVLLPSTNVILGNVGAGKSGLAYYLLETLSKQYDLLPVVVNFPEAKKKLLPEGYVIKNSEDLKKTGDCIALIDEGTTTAPAGNKELEEHLKSYNSLSRQRHMIIVYIYHSSSDVGSRILRGIYGAIMLKEPSARQIRYGSKDKWMRDILTEAKQKFKILQEMGEDTRAYTFIDTEKPEFQGMVKNELVSWWSQELSEAWAGVDVETQEPFTTRKSPSIIDMFKARDTDFETHDQYFDRIGVPQDPALRELIDRLDGEYLLEDLHRICGEQGLSVSKDKHESIWLLMQNGYFEGKDNASV